MFPSYRNQSVDLYANQLIGFYMMGTLVVKRLTKSNQLRGLTQEIDCTTYMKTKITVYIRTLTDLLKIRNGILCFLFHSQVMKLPDLSLHILKDAAMKVGVMVWNYKWKRKWEHIFINRSCHSSSECTLYFKDSTAPLNWHFSQN